MKGMRVAYLHLWEGMVVILLVVVIFNTLTDFATKVGWVTSALSKTQVQYFGTVSSLLTLMNLVSHEFFGFEFAQ